MVALKTTTASILSCNIKGAECRKITRHLKVRESICSEYIQLEITIIDPYDVLTNLGVSNGDPVSIAFNAPVNSRVYRQNFLITEIKSRRSPQNFRTIIYTIQAVGSEYYSDRQNVVQHVTPQMENGISIAQKIWGQFFDSSLRTPVQDCPFRTGDNSWTINMEKPFTALRKVRERMVFASYKTGNTLLFRDYDGEVLAPMQYLFDTLSAQESYVQSTTWGKKFTSIFETEHAVIDAKIYTRPGAGSGPGTQATASQGKRVFNQFQGKLSTRPEQILASSGFTGSLGSITNLARGISSGLLGSMPNIQLSDGNRQDPACDYTNKTEIERAYLEYVRNQPQYSIKVPLQLGINTTVGKGINVKLLPPSGDLNTIQKTGLHGGLMFVTDLVHEIENANKLVLGTTTYQTILKGSYRGYG